MAPIASAPNRGYAEWQRLSNYDGGLLYNSGTLSIPPLAASPVLDVSRYAYVGGAMAAVTGTGNVLLTWYSDAAGTVVLGQKNVPLNQNIGDFLRFRFVNLGPFCQFSLQEPSGAWSVNVKAFGSNRVYPIEAVPRDPQLITIEGAALGANATVIDYPSNYYDGPVRVAATAGQAFTVQPRLFDQNGAVHNIEQESGTAGNYLVFNTVVPLGAWRVEVTNTTATLTTYSLFVTPSLTGAT